MNRIVSKAVLSIVLTLAAASANAVSLSSSPVQLYDLFPSSTQGENGITLMSFYEPTGTYENLKIWSNSNWYAEKGIVLATIRTTTNTPNYIQFDLPDYSLDAVIKVNVTGEFSTLRIDQTVGSSMSHFSIYEGSNNFNSPLWSTSVGRYYVYSSSIIELPLNSSSDYYFRVNINADSGFGQKWQVAMSGVNPVPEADTSAMFLMGAGVMGFIARRRKQAAA